MATSGSFLTSVGPGGGNFYNRLIFEWWRTGAGISGNVGYHNISYTLKTYGGSSGYWQQLYNSSMNVDGQGYSRGSFQAYGAGATTVLSGSKTLYTDGNGNRSFGASAQAGIYYNNINTSGSGSWSLDNIALHAYITGTSGNINDESNPYISYGNPGGGGITAWLELPNLTGSTRYAQRNGYGGGNFNLSTGERNAIRAAMANTNATTIRYVIYTNNTGGYDWRDSTISIVNAAPVFSTVGYHDSNAATIAFTGDDQLIVQGQSTINVDISSGNKAVAQKGASMVSYTATINSVPTNIAYSGSTINQVLNAGSTGAATDQTLTVTATDSRGNTTSVQKTVTMIPYSSPTVTVNAKREDGFGEDTEIDVTGTYSPILVGGTPTNSVDTTTGIGYKVWEVGQTEPGSYTNITSSTSGVNITTPTDPIETLDSDKSWNLKVKITDEIQTVTTSTIIPIGVAAFRIGTDGKVYNENKLLMAAEDMFPVGAIYTSYVNTTPAIPGTWTSLGSQTLFGVTVYAWRRSA